jgi:hypothetical protein
MQVNGKLILTQARKVRENSSDDSTTADQARKNHKNDRITDLHESRFAGSGHANENACNRLVVWSSEVGPGICDKGPS